MIPFTPIETITVSATTSSVDAAFSTKGGAVEQMRVYNAGPNNAFLRFGVGTQTAVVTDMPVVAGAIELFTKGLADNVAAICATGTAVISVTAGEGE